MVIEVSRKFIKVLVRSRVKFIGHLLRQDFVTNIIRSKMFILRLSIVVCKSVISLKGAALDSREWF